MAEKVTAGPITSANGVREAVCIHTKKIFSSCKDKDCIEDLTFYPTATAQSVIDASQSIRGGRVELLDAMRSYMDGAHAALREGREPEPLSEATLSRHLYTADIPDPDLLIRTSGEMRVSNFLLWQIAYSEFVCTETLWPDFDRYEFLRALLEFQSRDRRFGAVK